MKNIQHTGTSCFLIFALNAFANAVNFTDFGEAGAIDFGFWHPSYTQGISTVVSFCAYSNQLAGEPFEFDVRNFDGYELENDNNEEVPFQVEYRNLLVGSNFEVLVNKVFASVPGTVQSPGCPLGDNIALRFTVKSQDIVGKNDGVFESNGNIRFRVRADNTNYFIEKPVRFSKLPFAKISGLSDVNLQSQVPITVLNSIQDACIYSDRPYTLLARSQNSINNNQFFMTSADNSTRVPYQVLVGTKERGFGNWVRLFEGQTSSDSFTSQADTPSCSNGLNFQLRIRVWIFAQEGLATGAYRDVLTLRVEME